MQADELDQRVDVRGRAAHAHPAAGLAQPAGDHREIDHQRGVRERQAAEVDDEVLVDRERTRQGGPAQTLRRAIFIPAAPQDRRVVRQRDDAVTVAQIERPMPAS